MPIKSHRPDETLTNLPTLESPSISQPSPHHIVAGGEKEVNLSPIQTRTTPPSLHRSKSSSAAEAAHILANFTTHPAHPRNWPRSKKWQITVIVSLTGFIATCGSSIGVPGVHAIIDAFGETNPKIGVLVTTVYVLGFG